MAEEKKFIPVVGKATSSGADSRPIGYPSAQNETLKELAAQYRPNFSAPLDDGKFTKPVYDNAGKLRTEGYKPFFIDEFKTRPDSSYRFIGSESIDWATDTNLAARKSALTDFYRTGQVRGELGSFDQNTYFSRGAGSTAYLPDVRDLRGETAKNLLYELNNRFDANKNPLYSVYGGFNKEQFLGGHDILTPNKDASFIDRINPANRKGLKITAFDTTERFVPKGTYAPESMMYTKPVVPEIIYDRTSPWYRTPVAQNLKNLGVEAKILGNTPLPSAVAPSLGAAGGVLSMGMQAYGATRAGHYDKNYGMSDPLGTRPAWDFMFNLAGGGYEGKPVSESWNEMGRLVADPEWQMRNPLTAPIYNLMHGNTEPAKAFAEGYKPFFTKK